MFGVEPQEGQGYETGLHRNQATIVSWHNSQTISSSAVPNWLKTRTQRSFSSCQCQTAHGSSWHELSHGTGLTLELSQPKRCQCLSKDVPLTALICENGNNIKTTQVTNHVQYHQETHLPLGNILHEEKGLQNTEPIE